MSELTLTDFLLARIAEDEAVARACATRDWTALPYMPHVTRESFRTFYDSDYERAPIYELNGPRVNEDDDEWPTWNAADATHIARHDPARVLAECEAKRRLIDWCAPVSGAERVPTDRPGVYDHRDVRYVNEDGEDVLRYLALPYAEHPDYRAEWRP